MLSVRRVIMKEILQDFAEEVEETDWPVIS